MRPAERQNDQPTLDLVDRLVRLVAVHHQDATALHRTKVLLRHVVRPARRQHEDHHLGGMEDPQVPSVSDLPLDAGEDQPTGLVGMPQRLPLAPPDQRLVHRLEERNQVPQAVGDRAQ